MDCLVTGFDPFGGMTVNPSQLVVEALAAENIAGLHTAILPTEFRAAGEAILRLIRETRPKVVLSCGLASDSACIRFERLARNSDDSQGTDNAGERRAGPPIDPAGPAEYAATLPYAEWAAAFAARGIPYAFSDDAGGFVCNHVFYRAAAEIAGSATKALFGFVHLPPLDLPSNAERHLDSKGLVDAIRLCIEIVASN